MRNSRRLLFALAALVLGAGQAWAGQIVVLEAEPATSTLRTGAILDGNQEITVPPGTSVVLMDEVGRVVTVTGPYRGIPGGAERKDGPGALKRVATAMLTADLTEIVGGVRAAGEAGKLAPLDPWFLDVTSNGTKCVRAGSGIVLWRPVPRRDTEIAITALAGGTEAKIAWPKGEATVAWPKEVPARDNAVFLLQLQDPRTSRKIRLRIIAAAASSDADDLLGLLDSGCAAQARILLASLAGHVVEGAAAKSGALFR